VNGTASGTTTPPPPPPSNTASATVTFADTNDWGSGFTGSLTLTNTGSSPINGWTLSFDFVGTISSIWNASITSHSGNQYSLVNASYNAVINRGQSVTIGFNASPGHAAAPTNYKLNGVAIS
jgi:cellulase/cellobiase CelA1